METNSQSPQPPTHVPPIVPKNASTDSERFPKERGAFRAAMYGMSAMSWTVSLLVIGGVFILGIAVAIVIYFAATFNDSVSMCGDANVAVIPLNGTISSDQIGIDTEGFTYTSYRYLADSLDDAAASATIDAVVLEVNSPGGEMVPSAEMASAIERFSEQKPIVSYIRTYGASGAYLAAAATDRIFAHRASEVGSIGVIISYLDEIGKNEMEGYGYVEFKSAPYKSAGSPYRELSSNEEGIFQKFVDDLHMYFVEEVARLRNLEIPYVLSLADGSTMLGVDAQDVGLIDEVGDEKTVFQYLADTLQKEVTPCYIETEYKSLGF